MARLPCKSVFSLRLSLAILSTAGVAGCERGPAVAQLSGTVQYPDGSPPRGAIRAIRFEPTEESTAKIRKSAGGDISAVDGSFQMFTRKPGDGVHIGEYAVTFAVLRDPKDIASSLIVDKYTSSRTTPYHVTVDRDIDDLKFEIEPLEP